MAIALFSLRMFCRPTQSSVRWPASGPCAHARRLVHKRHGRLRSVGRSAGRLLIGRILVRWFERRRGAAFAVVSFGHQFDGEFN